MIQSMMNLTFQHNFCLILKYNLNFIFFKNNADFSVLGFTVAVLILIYGLTLSFHPKLSAVHKVTSLLFISVWTVFLWIYQTNFLFIYLIYILAFVGAVLMLFLAVVLMLPISSVQFFRQSTLYSIFPYNIDDIVWGPRKVGKIKLNPLNSTQSTAIINKENTEGLTLEPEILQDISIPHVIDYLRSVTYDLDKRQVSLRPYTSPDIKDSNPFLFSNLETLFTPSWPTFIYWIICFLLVGKLLDLAFIRKSFRYLSEVRPDLLEFKILSRESWFTDPLGCLKLRLRNLMNCFDIYTNQDILWFQQHIIRRSKQLTSDYRILPVGPFSSVQEDWILPFDCHYLTVVYGHPNMGELPIVFLDWDSLNFLRPNKEISPRVIRFINSLIAIYAKAFFFTLLYYYKLLFTIFNFINSLRLFFGSAKNILNKAIFEICVQFILLVGLVYMLVPPQASIKMQDYKSVIDSSSLDVQTTGSLGNIKNLFYENFNLFLIVGTFVLLVALLGAAIITRNKK